MRKVGTFVIHVLVHFYFNLFFLLLVNCQTVVALSINYLYVFIFLRNGAWYYYQVGKYL